MITFLANVRDLRLDLVSVPREAIFVPVLTYGSQTVVQREKFRFGIMVVQIDEVISFSGIRRIRNDGLRNSVGFRKE